MAEHVLEAVRDLLPGIRERAAHTTKNLAVPDITVKELGETGLFAQLRPREFGGAEGELVTFCTAIKEVARACGSTGVVAAALGATPWRVALFPRDAQEEVWAEETETMASSTSNPSGTLTPARSGFIVAGRWTGVSGCEHADWMVVRGTLASGEEADVLLAPGEYSLETAEPLLGLRGAVTQDVVADDAVVASHRIRVLSSGEGAEPQMLKPSPVSLYRLPTEAVFPSALMAAVIGMAEGAFAEFVGLTLTRLGTHQLAWIAAAASEIDAAWLLMTRNICDMVAHTIAHEDIPEELLLRTRRDHYLAIERSMIATAALVESAEGAASEALEVSSPVTRHWRDVHTARSWSSVGSPVALARYGLAVLHDGGVTPANRTTQHLEEE